MTSVGSSELPTAPATKSSGDFQRMKEHGALTVEELREFLAKMRGKSPQEVLGLVASSDLVRATVQATIGCILLLAFATIVPYFLYAGAPKAAPAVAQKPQGNAPPTAAAAPATSNSADKKPDAAVSSTAATDPKQNNLEKAAKKMGMDETKVTDPKKNPLENNLDKLLDKLE